MDFIRANENSIVINIPLTKCKNCSKPMLKWSEQLPSYIDILVRRDVENLVKESYGDFGTCTDCVKKGGFKRKCGCCRNEKEFPKEFRYEFTSYAQFPEDETELYYVCNDCVVNSPQKVMNMFIYYDDASEIEK